MAEVRSSLSPAELMLRYGGATRPKGKRGKVNIYGDDGSFVATVPDRFVANRVPASELQKYAARDIHQQRKMQNQERLKPEYYNYQAPPQKQLGELSLASAGPVNRFAPAPMGQPPMPMQPPQMRTPMPMQPQMQPPQMRTPMPMQPPMGPARQPIRQPEQPMGPARQPIRQPEQPMGQGLMQPPMPQGLLGMAFGMAPQAPMGGLLGAQPAAAPTYNYDAPAYNRVPQSIQNMFGPR